MKKLLGKKDVRHDRRTLRLSKYLPTLPPVPNVWPAWSPGITNWGVMLNNRLGDCTIAACGHMIRNWHNVLGSRSGPTDADILAAYEGAAGYNPADPATDQGSDGLTVLNYWRQTGIGSDKILAYLALDQGNVAHLKAAIYLFGGAWLGLAMPQTAENQSTWHITAAGLQGAGTPGSWGGHAIPVFGYGQKTLPLVSWGARYEMTWGFMLSYTDESYVALSRDWLNLKGLSPAGFNLAALQADLAAL